MSLAGDGLLRPEPTKADAIRARMRAGRADIRRQRATAGALWLLFGALMTLAALAAGLGLELNYPLVAATGLVATALWCGVTAVILVRSK